MLKNFRYGINRDRQIDLDIKDMGPCREIAMAEPTLNVCISCGTCAATCSATYFTTFSLRKVIIMLKRGEYKGLNEEVSKCMLCGKCQLACPRNVNTRNLILQIQKTLNAHGLN